MKNPVVVMALSLAMMGQNIYYSHGNCYNDNGSFDIKEIRKQRKKNQRNKSQKRKKKK